MAVFVTVFVVMMVLPVVRAPFRLAGQLAVQVGRNQCFDRLIRNPGHDLDAMLGKDGQGALADAADNDQFDAQALQPARKCSGDMFGRRQSLGAQEGLGVGIHLNNRKLAAAAEMRIKPAVFNRNSNLHNFVICPLN